ncbi:succinate-semialdehyde dehydrogenase [Dactylonectria macrodidyma]|uniref:Succinate-semialdehyde dehydrogenase n=1 Tax=Dactylonectria macrodidyma TaxID=307937 RepID=A0A9P9IJS4_9HYPO|nr:succinate-semialdehyde dehydrogenase [Dactylonectria macrodidyma]
MLSQLPFQLDQPSLMHDSSLLNGEWVQSQSSESFEVEDPGTGKPFATCPTNKAPDVEAFVKTSQEAFLEYRHLNPRVRAKLIKWHELITNAREDIAKLVTYEKGKLLTEARGEVDNALGFAWWFAGEAERIRRSIVIPSVSERRTFVIKQPIGLCVALVPWSFPVAMIIRKVAAALAAGSVSESLCKHPLARKVTFTGSTAVGKLIARYCTEGLKKVTLELGACTHANRVYVQSGVYDKFAKMMLEATQKLLVGHGAEPSSTMSALTTPRGIEKLEKHISDAVSKGGKVLCGGTRPATCGGYFFEPTIISDMTSSMLTTNEEIFGPLLGLYKFETEEEVVKAANDTSMGLASYFFTENTDRTWRLLENLEAGMIRMNMGNSSGAESPFGGIKESGYGKEAGKHVAIEEYLIAKTGTLTVDLVSKL